MQSLSDPIEALHGEVQWMCRDHAVRLLWVRCAGDLRNVALKLLPRYEFHHDNRDAWLVVEDAWTRADHGWSLRATRLVQNWEARRQAFASEGLAMPPIHQPSVAGLSDLGTFLAIATAVCASVAAPLNGYLLVLAPTLLDDPAVFEQQLASLIAVPNSSQLRFIVITGFDHAGPPELVRALGVQGLYCECEIDDEQQGKDLAAMLSPSRPQGLGAGAVPLGVEPPVKVGAAPMLAPEAKAELLREAGLNPAYLDAAPQIRAGILGAALAMKQGRGSDAVELLSSAGDHCAASGQPLLQIMCQINLASYLSGLGQRPQAIAELESASSLAEANALWIQQCQAYLALGLLHGLDCRPAEAVQAYRRAGEAAERGQSWPLAIEAWRMAGQLLLQNGHGSEAAAWFHRAIEVANQTPPDQVRSSSASEAARALAKLYGEHGQSAQAASLYAQADAFESGAPEVGESGR